MSPRAASADAPQTPEQIREAIEAFIDAHAKAVVLEDGKVAFELRSGSYALSTDHGRCTLQLWSPERNTVRRVVSAAERSGTLRLATQRMGQAGTKLLELVADREKRTPTVRESGRAAFLKRIERVLARHFAEWNLNGFRAAMDLEKSFGPAYVRGSLTRGQQAWAVIAVGAEETSATIDGILTLGILWLDACRAGGGGKRLYQGLKLILPRGTAALTLARVRWLHGDAARWEVYEFDEEAEELVERDAHDSGNLHTRLIHHPDPAGAEERFRDARKAVHTLVPEAERARMETLLRSPAEMVFLLHGLEFARARIVAGAGFARAVEVTVGSGASETLLTAATAEALHPTVAALFARRRADASERTRDPLFRTAPERWLESVLRQDLAPLTRHLGPRNDSSTKKSGSFANELDEDTIGNRIDATPSTKAEEAAQSVIPRLDPHHVYTQVAAIAGAGDRGMLDLLGITADGRLAVIELKAHDDLHLALQGLDYWIRVRHHHRESADAHSGLGAFQSHGYFTGLQLSALDPRLYLVAPALHIHPATEVVLRYLSPQVEWHLLALDERWRSRVKVVWRKQSGRS